MMYRKLKYLSVSLILCLALLISACVEQEQVEPEIQTGLLGTWNNASISVSKCERGNQADPDLNAGCTDESCIKFQFDENGDFAVIFMSGGVSESIKGVYHIYGDHLTMNIDGDVMEADFIVNNKNLRLIVDQDNIGCHLEISFTRD